MKLDNLLISRKALVSRISAFALSIHAALLAALAVSILTVGCGGRSTRADSESDSARIARLRQIDDSVMTLAPSAQRLITEGMRTAPDSMTLYEYRLRQARLYSLSDAPERYKSYVDGILRFADEQRKQNLTKKQTRRLNTLVAGAYNCRAAYYHNFHRHKDQAVELYKSAYHLLAQSDSKHNMPKVCANLADAYIYDNDLPKAAQWYRRALFLVDSLSLPEKENITLYMGLAQIYLSLHDFDTALHYYKATENYFQLMSPPMQAYFLNNFGNYYYYKKDYPHALEKFLRMKRTIERHGMQNNFDMYLCKVNLADVYLNMDSISRAEQYVDEIEPYFRERHDFTSLHYCKTIRIGIATKSGRTADVQHMIGRNDETAKHPVQYSLANLRNIYLQRYYEKVGDYRQAYRLMQEIGQYNDSLEHNHSNMRSAEIMARFTSDTLKLHHDLTIEHKNATIEKTQKMLLLSLTIVMLLVLLFVLWIMRSKRKEMKAQMDIMNLRLNNVRNRISPHFVFNVLNNKIVNAGRVDDTELLDLTRLIRTNLDMSRQPAVKLAEELDFVEKYIRVERFMLGDDFVWHINVAADVDREKVLVPSMFLQILTENAIIHGLKGWDGHKELCIEVHREQHTTVINVSDNGPGFSTFNGTFKKKTGLGIIAQTVAINNEHNKNKIRFEIKNIEHDGNVCGCRATVRVPDGVKFL